MGKTAKSSILELRQRGIPLGYELVSTEYVNMGLAYQWKCQYGHDQFRARYYDLKVKKTRCPGCSRYKYRDMVYVNKIVTKRGFICTSKEFPGVKGKINLICPNGHAFSCVYICFEQGWGCYMCSGKAQKTIKELQLEAIKRGGELLSTVYKNANTKLHWQCAEKHEFWMRWGSMSQGQWCPKCADTTGNINELHDVADKHGGWCLDTVYTNRQYRYTWKCCDGHVWRATAYNVLGGGWCRKCIHRQEQIDNYHKITNKIIDREGRVVTTEDEYTNNKALMTIICENEHEFKMRANDIDQNHWCPRCVDFGPSVPQIEMFETIKSFDLNVVMEESLDRFQIDIVVKNTGLAIEFNGLYYHSHAISNRYCKPFKHGYHQRKYDAITKQGYRFLAIYEDEWLNKRPLVEELIRHHTDKWTGITLQASELDLKEVHPAQATDFFKKNHLNGGLIAIYPTLSYGLYQDGQLIMCAAAVNNELAPLATAIGYKVVGGASRLLCQFPRPLVALSNNRLNDHEVYMDLGFRFEGDVGHRHWYTDLKQRLDLGDVKLDKVIGKDGKTWYRIEDYGYRKWVLE